MCVTVGVNDKIIIQFSPVKPPLSGTGSEPLLTVTYYLLYHQPR